MVNLFNYIEKDSPVHRLTGAAKLVGLLLWSIASMTTFYTPLLAVLTVAAFLLFGVSHIKLREVGFMLKFTFVFMILNNVLIFIFSPQHAVSIYGSRTVLFEIAGPYIVTAEQLFYHLNVALKYTCSIPVVLLFVSTTNPSEFAASLNRIGVSYRISYAVSIALRYIPDIQREYYDISKAQQARGIEMSKKAGLVQRLKSVSVILIPLILSSLERICAVLYRVVSVDHNRGLVFLHQSFLAMESNCEVAGHPCRCGQVLRENVAANDRFPPVSLERGWDPRAVFVLHHSPVDRA